MIVIIVICTTTTYIHLLSKTKNTIYIKVESFHTVTFLCKRGLVKLPKTCYCFNANLAFAE